MSKQTTKILLNTATILNLPIKNYNEEFTFIVNGDKYNTTCLISDLISPNICKIHKIDPTLSSYVINTKEKGNFSYILDLVKFSEIDIPVNEIHFVIEVIEILGNSSIELLDKVFQTNITKENVFTLISKHEQNDQFYSNELSSEINFIASNFYELCAAYREKMNELSINILSLVVTNPLLQLIDEDQLFNFISDLYLTNPKYAVLYDSVHFGTLSINSILKMITILKYDDLKEDMWTGISDKISQKSMIQQDRYQRAKNKGIYFSVNSKKPFDGIFKYIIDITNKQISNEVKFTSTNEKLSIYYLFSDNPLVKFATKNQENQWLCFDFKDHMVSLDAYVISSEYCSNSPRSWVVEGSINNESWEIIDEIKYCSNFKEKNRTVLFEIHNRPSKMFRYIRIKQTGLNWANNNILEIKKLEIFGRYI